jgi:hypothetical protein
LPGSVKPGRRAKVGRKLESVGGKGKILCPCRQFGASCFNDFFGENQAPHIEFARRGNRTFILRPEKSRQQAADALIFLQMGFFVYELNDSTRPAAVTTLQESFHERAVRSIGKWFSRTASIFGRDSLRAISTTTP